MISEAPPRRRWLTALLLTVVLLLAAMWVYAFGFAPRGGVNPVRDKAWTDGAQAVCLATGAQLAPLVFHTQITSSNKDLDVPKFVTNLDRAVIVVSGMLDQLDAVPRTSDKAKVLVPQWLTDYRQWVADLRSWIDQLRQGQIIPFGVSITNTGIPIDERINAFATENRIKPCRIDQLQG